MYLQHNGKISRPRRGTAIEIDWGSQPRTNTSSVSVSARSQLLKQAKVRGDPSYQMKVNGLIACDQTPISPRLPSQFRYTSLSSSGQLTSNETALNLLPFRESRLLQLQELPRCLPILLKSVRTTMMLEVRHLTIPFEDQHLIVVIGEEGVSQCARFGGLYSLGCFTTMR